MNGVASGSHGVESPRADHVVVVAALVTVAGVFVALFWDAWGVLLQRWASDPDYTHGFLVPLVSVYLLWQRRGMLKKADLSPSLSAVALGIGCLMISGVIRATSLILFARVLDPAAIVPCVFGLILLLGGWGAFRWAWPSALFLIFMLPLPGFVSTLLSHPLQRAATIASTFLLQTFGVSAMAEGNVIALRDGQLEVVQACSGLKMMSLFVAVCFAAAFIMRRPILDRLLVVISAPVNALAANVIRITVTGVLHELHLVGTNMQHDLAGWAMMPAAVLLVWAELYLLDRILVPRSDATPLVVSVERPRQQDEKRKPTFAGGSA
ncbi:MAG: exosortase/archaeosortase family protein [Thermogutta sp.]